ncbi:MAG: carboxyl transferase domain-containing protein [Acidimicrobiales bacterium]
MTDEALRNDVAVTSGDASSPDVDPAMAELTRRREIALAMGGPAGIARHRESGRLTVRERVERLVDPGTWHEVGLLAEPEFRRDKPVPADAVVTGYARIDGREVALIGIDSTILAGTTAPVSMRKQGRLIEMAQRAGTPIVYLCDADGGRMPDVMGWRFSGLPLDFRTFLESPPGVPHVPRAAAVLGPSYGDAALHASTSHFVVMIEAGSCALSGPSVVGRAIGEKVDHGSLAGPELAETAGNVHLTVEAEDDAFEALAAFLSFMPPTEAHAAPLAVPREPATDPAAIAGLVPSDPRRGYDMHAVVASIVDGDSILPWGHRWGPAVVCFLARIEGQPVGVVASQPLEGAGALDPSALAKEAAFVDICDTFNLPLLFLQDVPGLLIGTDAERGGILHAYETVTARIARASVPKVTVVIRKAYGGGHFALGGRPTRPDFVYAWPSAELGFMAPEVGIAAVHRRVLEQAMADGGQEAFDAAHAELEREWHDESQPWEAAANFHLDDVIDPAQTRRVVARSFEVAWGSSGRVRETRR